MNNIGFITNKDKDSDFSLTKELINFVTENGCNVFVDKIMGNKIGIKSVSSVGEIFLKSNFIIVLGGDGTILNAAGKAAQFDVPILGINIGRLGYLADVERSDAKKAIKNVLDGNYRIEKRMMLEAYTENNNKLGEAITALNEISVRNGIFSRMIEISLSINDQYFDTYRADGIIVSTPTGSTAHNLAAGGPILKPDTELMAITYLCPHALFSRPMVVSGNDVVKITIGGDYNNAMLSVDGRQGPPIKNGDSIIIRQADCHTDIIRTTDLSFYDILRNKMVEVRK